MAITKSQVEAAITKATVGEIKQTEDIRFVGEIIWDDSGLWTPKKITLEGKTEKQTETLINVLEDLHNKSEIELTKCSDLWKKSTSFIAGLSRALVGYSATSWFDWMISAMKLFGDFVEEKVGADGKISSKKDKSDIIELADDVKKMVENYVDHSIFRKIAPLVSKPEDKSWKDAAKRYLGQLSSTKEFIATLCRCVNYGKMHSFASSWLKNITELAE